MDQPTSILQLLLAQSSPAHVPEASDEAANTNVDSGNSSQLTMKPSEPPLLKKLTDLPPELFQRVMLALVEDVGIQEAYKKYQGVSRLFARASPGTVREFYAHGTLSGKPVLPLVQYKIWRYVYHKVKSVRDFGLSVLEIEETKWMKKGGYLVDRIKNLVDFLGQGHDRTEEEKDRQLEVLCQIVMLNTADDTMLSYLMGIPILRGDEALENYFTGLAMKFQDHEGQKLPEGGYYFTTETKLAVAAAAGDVARVKTLLPKADYTLYYTDLHHRSRDMTLNYGNSPFGEALGNAVFS
ncbi:hypothetical protein BU23DRAFT_570054 [Bimuria novae-zelandiae CBS 107.79]|uniref:Uncharacterized protein n=1 Tax=Bimuria novae-zelandiae CBS 107.79 TaxID=1447943 RepID=A0A6A5V333_9PLEO|nr:hypothetical protein BU23DRAFT_570054 [Bimuria novae-zelandiae CBS 107.79]